MTKFQRFQKISSIVPYYSSIFVFIVTMIELRRRNASAKNWFYYILTFFLSGIGVYILNSVVMTGQHKVLNVIASGLLLAVANIICVDLQVQCVQKKVISKPTQNKKKLIVCFVLVGVFTVSVFTFFAVILFTPTMDVEDCNGSNTNLAVIKMDEILTTVDDFSAFSSFSSYSGLKTKVTGNLKDYDFEKAVFRCQQISGIKTLHVTKTDCNYLTLDIKSVLEAGNLEIVIMVNDEFYDKVPVNQTHTIVLNGVAQKTVVVRIAAESAKLDISVIRRTH